MTGERPSARAFHTATLVPGVGVVVFGGLSFDGHAHRDAFVLTVLPKDETNGSWTLQWKQLGSCRWPRAGHVAAYQPSRVSCRHSAPPALSANLPTAAFGSIQGLFFVGGMMRSRAGEDIFRTDGCMLRIGAWQRPSAGLSWMYTDETVRLPPRRCMAGALVGQRLLLHGGCEGQPKSQLLDEKQR